MDEQLTLEEEQAFADAMHQQAELDKAYYDEALTGYLESLELDDPDEEDEEA